MGGRQKPKQTNRQHAKKTSTKRSEHQMAKDHHGCTDIRETKGDQMKENNTETQIDMT